MTVFIWNFIFPPRRITMKMPTKHIDSELVPLSTSVPASSTSCSKCKRGQWNEALGVLHQMHQKGISFNFNTHASLLQTCGNAKEKRKATPNMGFPFLSPNWLVFYICLHFWFLFINIWSYPCWGSFD